MKMNKTKEITVRLLTALAFATAALAAVLCLLVAWSVFVYHSNIRVYAPNRINRTMLLGLVTLVLLFRLAAVARRRRSNAAPYVAVGCLAAPAAVLVFSVYTSLLLMFSGQYSWQLDVAMNSVGGTVCTVMAIVFYRVWLSKRADNHTSEGIRRPADGSPKPSI